MRGLFLVLMTVTHIPSLLSAFAHEPVGIMSSAEGFVFLAACLCGMVYGRQLRRNGWEAMRERMWHRARRVYLAHLLVLIPVALLALTFASQSQVLHNHFGPLLSAPLLGFALMPLLLHQPPLFDVLPLYVLCLLGTPYLLRIAATHGWRRLLILGGMLWLLAQAGRGFRTGIVMPHLLFIHPGHFDLLAWQFIWVSGLALGDYSSRKGLAGLQDSRLTPLYWTCGIVAMAGFGLRHDLWPQTWFHPDIYLYISKWTLGPLRVLNMVALVLLVLRWNPQVPATLLDPLATLGRHSLAVFTLHLPMVVLATVIIERLKLAGSLEPSSSLLGAGCVLTLYLFASVSDRQAGEMNKSGRAGSSVRAPLFGTGALG